MHEPLQAGDGRVQVDGRIEGWKDEVDNTWGD